MIATPQRIRILHYMMDFGSITQLDATREFGCTRLASRIAELKASGIPIRKDMVTMTNRYGEPTHFASYSIEEKV